MELRYIALNGKTPVEKLANGGHDWDEVKDFESIGVLIPEPFVVLDFDTKSDSDIMLKLAIELNLPCKIMRTERGYHFWFKAQKPWKNFVKTRLAIGIYCDCRSYGKLSYTVVKLDGVMRECVKYMDLEAIGEVPTWLRPLAFGKYEFKNMGEGDGRNQMLYEYVLIMQTKGYTKVQIKEALRVINQFVFKEALSKGELEVILRDDSFKSEEELTESAVVDNAFTEEGGFKHNVFANELASSMQVITVNGQLYIYDNGYYHHADVKIEKEMIARYKRIRRSQRAEVLDYMRILTSVNRESLPIYEYIITLNNTRLDLRSGKTLPFDPKVIEFTCVPVDYDPTAYSSDLDNMLNKVFNGNREVLDLFEEMVGYTLVKNCRFRKGFLFYGGGSNGKSTVLNLLKKFIGDENCSTIEMEKLADKFKTAELEHKLINIGDDINRKDIVDTGTLKKLFTGESFSVERKNMDPFTLKTYAKLIFSCNEIPRIADKSNGMYSRLMLIPFTARFSSADDDFDPFIEDKITTPVALSYLLNLGLKGLKRLFKQNAFTLPKVVNKALEDYKTDNSTVLTWAMEEEITLNTLLSKSTDELFSNFKDWCGRSDIKFNVSLRTFHKELEDRYRLERIRRRVPTNAKSLDKEKAWWFVVSLT